ncbi:AsnC family transcriptional regulator [Amycolatopsis deserti]|uniref:AsnC family transcriptional regulator n=1 Tax=Amycolatopsis deserti TaxID=185696 RepID=A0ABQ3IJX2_9PSEU|nr:AsnC family transcriptional regulator [Amycolatopsis deserti]GHE84050.1 AsnC family transcriptional regulator [Amycolatopsis deserti]
MADALDLQIINAVQIHPRVSWAQLGRVLRVDPSTISRRWSALTESRQVWTCCYECDDVLGVPAGLVSAIVEVRCAPGQRGAVIAELVRQGPVFSVSCTSGPRDLYLLISTDTLLSMDRYVDERISVVPGVTGTRTHYLRTIYIEGSKWRLRALDAGQVAALETMRPSDPPAQRKPAYQPLIEALATDVRRTAAELQAELGRSVSVIARDIDAVLAAGWVRWRVDFAHTLLGWQAGAMLWLDVPHPELDRVVASLRTLHNVRLCGSVTGSANLAVWLWLRDLQELDEIESRLAVAYPRVRIRDRWIVPRIAKRTGYTLDLDSRWLDHVPISGRVVFED